MTAGGVLRRLAQPGVTVLLVLAGCQDVDWFKKPPPPEPKPQPRAAQTFDPVVAGSIGAQTLVSSADMEPLRGFGLVVGLNGTGSSDCPTVIREYLIDYLAKQVRPEDKPERRRRPSPEALIDSPNTAVVEIRGVVPTGARRFTRFDLQVEALPGTSTTSLEGGILLPTQMRFFDRAASGQGMLAGAVLAEGGGPLFINPFGKAAEATSDADPRRGYVLGGGRALEARPVRLVLLQPSYALARTMERRINERFGQKPKAAEARSSGYLVLNTPPELARTPERFRQLVAHLYVDNQPAFCERKARELVSLAAGDGANHEHIALAWEGMGRSVIPQIQTFYTHGSVTLRFYAARTGLRLGDAAALPVMSELAASGGHSQRLLAIRELGDCDSPQAALSLAPLLSAADQEIRIAAYEALLQRSHPAIRSVQFRHLTDRSQLSFILDVVECDGPLLIHVRRTRLPRLAVFGRRVPVTPPVFYAAPDDSLTIHTVEDSDDLQVFAKERGRLSEDIAVPPRVVDLVTALADLPLKDEARPLRGLGLPYSRVVQVLAALCRDQTIPAALVLEQTPLTELLGPELTPERPERDTPAGGRPGPSTRPATSEPAGAGRREPS